MTNEQGAAKPQRRWVDATINLQALIGSLVGAAIMLAVAWFGIVGRVQALEAKGVEHEARFNRVEGDMRQQRLDMKEQLNGIGQDVKEIRGYLMDNAAGARPDIRRWAR